MLLRWIASVVIVGAVWGFLTSLGQTYLPEPARQIANSAAIWLLASFVVGWVSPSLAWAAGGGFTALVVADVAFYLGMYAQFGIVGSWAGDEYYLLGAVVAGPALGAAGRLTRIRSRWAAFAAAVLAAVFFAEAGLRATSSAIDGGFVAGWLLLTVIGCTALVVTLPWTRSGPLGLVAVVPFAVLGYLGLRFVLPAIAGAL